MPLPATLAIRLGIPIRPGLREVGTPSSEDPLPGHEQAGCVQPWPGSQASWATQRVAGHAPFLDLVYQLQNEERTNAHPATPQETVRESERLWWVGKNCMDWKVMNEPGSTRPVLGARESRPPSQASGLVEERDKQQAIPLKQEETCRIGKG